MVCQSIGLVQKGLHLLHIQYVGLQVKKSNKDRAEMEYNGRWHHENLILYYAILLYTNVNPPSFSIFITVIHNEHNF